MNVNDGGMGRGTLFVAICYLLGPVDTPCAIIPGNPTLDPRRKSMKILFRLIKELLKFLGIFLFLQIPGSIILGIYFLINPHVTLSLPYWLRWFDGADQYFGRDTTVYDKVMKGSAWDKYVWLSWRNPLNYFGYRYLGIDLPQKVIIICDKTERAPVLDSRTANETMQIGDGINKCPGTYFVEIECNSKIYWEYYRIIKYSLLGQQKCIRLRFGWKIGQDRPIESGYCQWVFVISPYHSYDGV